MAGTTAAGATAASAAPESPYVQPTFNYALRIWWAFYWPLNVGLIVVAFVSAVVFGILYRNVVISSAQAVTWGIVGVVGMFYFSFSFLLMFYILNKKFRHFRVALVSSQDYAHPQLVPRTGARVVRVWFAYMWRILLYGIVVAFVSSFPISAIIGGFSRMPLVFAFLKIGSQIALNGAVGLYVIYNNVLDESFGDARVCLLPRDAEPSATQANAVVGPAVS